jgi:hypothetical protein
MKMAIHKKLNEARIAFTHCRSRSPARTLTLDINILSLATSSFQPYASLTMLGFARLSAFPKAQLQCTLSMLRMARRLSFTAQWDQPILKVATRFRTLALVRLIPPATSGQQPFALSSMTHWMLPQAQKIAAPAKFISASQFAELQALVDETKTDMALLCKHYKINALKELQDSRFDAVKAALEKKLA